MIKNNNFNYYIYENLINAFEFLKSNKNKKNNKKKDKYEYSRIMWIIPFYSEKQILNKKDENIYISIDSNDNIIIFFFDFKKNNKNEVIKIITKKRIDILSLEKIIRLNKSFNRKDLNNNYFLIGTHFHNSKSKIIKISHNYKDFETIQTIPSYDGLIFLTEFKYNKNYYLLHNYFENFSLWNYNEDINNIECKIIKPNLNNINLIRIDNGYIQYRIINYIKNKNIFIIHVLCESPYLLFYKIDDNSKDFNLILIGRTTLTKEDNKFSSVYNNNCIMNDKYLLISSQSNYVNNKTLKNNKKDDKENIENKNDKDKKNLDEQENKKDGGIYIISLENFEIIRFLTINDSRFVNSCLFYKDNIFICNYSYYHHRKNIKRTNYKLLLFQLIEEENEKIKMISKDHLIGNYSFIDSSSMILNNFLISSNGKTNSLVKVNKNEKLTVYGDIELKNY